MFKFEAIYYADKLKIVNPYGTIGIVTLWSDIRYIEKLLRDAGVDLDAATTPIAVLGNLYGGGIRELIRNLLYNPQIDSLILFGRNRSGSAEDLIAFFREGIELLDSNSSNIKISSYSAKPAVIKGRNRIIDNLVTPEMLSGVRIFYAGEPHEKESIRKLLEFLRDYADSEHSSTKSKSRIKVPLPDFSVSAVSYPSNPRVHTIWADDPITAWKELIHRLLFFGNSVELRKGRRRELQNVKVIIEKPQPVSDDDLKHYGFDPIYVRQYEREFLSGNFINDTSYTYGHRMRSYFKVDQVKEVISRLRNDPEDRRSYIVLWDPQRDLSSEESAPCFVSAFFRKHNDKLTLTAVFRTHNALDAWLVNFHGLMTLLRYVAESIEKEPGAITIISHSISINERDLDRAFQIASEREFKYRPDPSGHFIVRLEGNYILVDYYYNDVILKTYRSDKASRLQYEIARDGVISEISHAIYLGRQLERAEWCLRTGERFVQD